MRGRPPKEVWVNGQHCPSMTAAYVEAGVSGWRQERRFRDCLYQGKPYVNADGERFDLSQYAPMPPDARMPLHDHTVGTPLIPRPCVCQYEPVVKVP